MDKEIMKIKDLDNIWDVWKLITQPTIDREPNETDEHYRERLLKYMEVNQ